MRNWEEIASLITSASQHVSCNSGYSVLHPNTFSSSSKSTPLPPSAPTPSCTKRTLELKGHPPPQKKDNYPKSTTMFFDLASEKSRRATTPSLTWKMRAMFSLGQEGNRAFAATLNKQWAENRCNEDLSRNHQQGC